MKTNPLYDVFFTVLMCCICAGMLTFANVQWRHLIKANEQFAHTFAIVNALGFVERDEPDKKLVMATFASNVKEKLRGAMTVFEGRKDDERSGYALDMEARGKYGPIKGVLAIGPRKGSIRALRIFQHNETPGLGGRIEEPEWQEQFAGIPLKTNGVVGVEIVKKKVGPNQVDGITGASKTMHSLQQAINTVIAQFLAGGIKLAPLNLNLSPDTITKASPGYPKKAVKPPHLREEVKRPDFMVQPGVEVLSVKKPVTCSVDMGPIIGELEQVTDNIRTCTEFDYVELDPDPQWVQIDLEEVANVHCVVIWHYYKNPVIYNDVIVQIADDPEFTKNVRTVFNNDHDDSSGLGKGEDTAFIGRWWGELIDLRGPDHEGTATRCVRVWTNGGAANEPTRFAEIYIYGMPATSAVAQK